MTRLTTVLATLFFVTSLILFYLAANRDRRGNSVTDLIPAAVQQSTDAAESDAPPAATSDSTESDLPATEAAPAATEEADMPATGTEGSGN